MNVVEENIDKIVKFCNATGYMLSDEEITKLKEKHYKEYIKSLEADIEWYRKENKKLEDRLRIANERINQLSEMLEV